MRISNIVASKVIERFIHIQDHQTNLQLIEMSHPEEKRVSKRQKISHPDRLTQLPEDMMERTIIYPLKKLFNKNTMSKELKPTIDRAVKDTTVIMKTVSELMNAILACKF